MSEARRYLARARSPASGSRYAFLVAGQKILDEDSSPPLLDGEIPLSAEMSLHERRYAEKWNPFLKLMQDTCRKQAKEALLGAGVPAVKLVEPLEAATEDLLRTLTDHALGEFDLLDRICELENRKGYRSVPAHVRILMATRLSCFHEGLAAAAKALNAGLHRRSGDRGLTRDHIRRASEKFLKFCKVLPTTRMRNLGLTVVYSEFAALDCIRTKAAGCPEFAALSGEELAIAIHEKHHLPWLVAREMNRQPFVDFAEAATTKAA